MRSGSTKSENGTFIGRMNNVWHIVHLKILEMYIEILLTWRVTTFYDPNHWGICKMGIACGIRLSFTMFPLWLEFGSPSKEGYEDPGIVPGVASSRSTTPPFSREEDTFHYTY